MRDIKFRQWRPESKTWHYFEFRDGFCSGVINATLSVYPIYQYTGLKDKNGVEIYEGDIIKYKGDNCIVEYFKDMFHMKSTKYINLSPGNYRLASLHDNYEIIGNIHENGDLIGKN